MISLGMAILGPHYSTLDVTLQDFRLSREFGLVASMHQGGGPARAPEGWDVLEAEGLVGPLVNIVHGNDLPDDQLERFVAMGVRFTVTPESEMISGPRPPDHSAGCVTSAPRLRSAPTSKAGIPASMMRSARTALTHQRALDNLDARGERNFRRQGAPSRRATR